MKLDTAVIELLQLDSGKTTVSSAGGGGCSSASTAKITTILEDGSEKCFFMKTATGKDAKVMFEGTVNSPFVFRFTSTVAALEMRPWQSANACKDLAVCFYGQLPKLLQLLKLLEPLKLLELVARS